MQVILTQDYRMKIENIHIHNIGPFKDARVDFNTVSNMEDGTQPITVITGVNGAGKSIVLDAIRCALSGHSIGRSIVADKKDFLIEMDMVVDGEKCHAKTSTLNGEVINEATDYYKVSRPLRFGYEKPEDCKDWVIDYWSSNTPTDGFKITNMYAIDHKAVLKEALLGQKKNVDLINFICQIDYLRTSEMPQEKALGNAMYEKLKEIIDSCLDNGKFLYIRRSDLTPIIEQNGTELTFEKLSSGNLFLIQHILLLMCKMYSVSVMRNLAPEDIFKIPGLLLIDEIETHLHPKWQKKILGIIRNLFPNLQIILTTHSPFVVASVDGAAIYTCIPHPDGNELRNETERYGHMPVDEVLASDVFGVNPFNEHITELMAKRKQYIEVGEIKNADKIAEQLYTLNPEYFVYLNKDLLGNEAH